MTKLSGSCLCGNVHYEGESEVKMVINCHCSDCQKATGSVHGTMVFVDETSLNVGGSPMQFDHPADSGNTLSKIFCGKCGSQVLGKNSGREGVIGIRAGTLDQKDVIVPGANIYCESAVSSTPMNGDLKKFPKMPG